MLDYRHETFLTLCRIRSYTKTAQALHLTQPAVTQHIKALEAHYGHSLFVYADKTLSLTEHGEQLYKFASTMAADSDYMTGLLRREKLANHPLRFGATLSIGEYVMAPILEQLMRTQPGTPISMLVENTRHLLKKLNSGEIQFALLEGFFDKAAYRSELFSLEPFIAVCAKDSPLASRTLRFEEAAGNNLILREKGSGTREILEHLLQEQNLSIASFASVTEIGNMAVIKKLVERGQGITFLYHAAAKKELEQGRLRQLTIEGLNARREFNFVFLKNSLHTDEFLEHYRMFKAIRDRMR
ncbi:LysR family transcriptional regulator [Oscillospiraceae bacterium MB08-C2-2]|nr:LysR family transcriptional regulator [Oscillospiraceae bacterium MB08-C2-2]